MLTMLLGSVPRWRLAPVFFAESAKLVMALS